MRSKLLINKSKLLMNRTELLMNRTELLMNRTELLMNRIRLLMNRTILLVNKTLFAMNKPLLVVTAFCLGVVLLFSINYNTKEANASDGIIRTKCVETIQIKEGDTLWTLATAYYTTEYKNLNNLIEEIKVSNHIGDTVYIGQRIIIPHYKEIT